jgi:hypothetical protein
MNNEIMSFDENAVIKFEYNIEQLNKVADEAKSIDVSNIDQVQEMTKKLVKVRGIIQKEGKAYRDASNAFNKRVLSEEKKYLEIIEPIEIEYKNLIEEDKKKKIIEARKELLPTKKSQLSLLKIVQPSDEEILSLDEEGWVTFYNAKFQEHERNIKQEEDDKQREREQKEREERLVKEAQERAEKEKEEALARAEKEKQDAIEKMQKEKELEELRVKEAQAEKERKEKEEKEKLEADKKYQDFLKENNFNEETDRIVEKDGVVRLYRIVAEFNK